METLNYNQKPRFIKIEKLVKHFFIFYLLMFSVKTMGQDNAHSEPKVDYLQRIYFSGENHEGLMSLINETILELNDKDPTPGLASQFAYLMGIQEKAENADNACDVLDLLSAGIYDIDQVEATKVGVLLPTDNAKEKTGDALASLKKINEATKSFSNTTGKLTWASYHLVNSNYSVLNKLVGTTNVVSQLAGMASEAGQTANEIKSIAKSLGIGFKGKDKPCKGVPKKDIPLGEHREEDEKFSAVGGEAKSERLTTQKR